jgi:hypothetical protein
MALDPFLGQVAENNVLAWLRLEAHPARFHPVEVTGERQQVISPFAESILGCAVKIWVTAPPRSEGSRSQGLRIPRDGQAVLTQRPERAVVHDHLALAVRRRHPRNLDRR